MDEALVADIIEIEQLLARYATGMTQDDLETVMDVFTPDGTYSAFGATYTLGDFPALVAAAPKGLFLTGTPVLDLHGDSGTGHQTLCFVAQLTHEMRIGWYTDAYRRTEHGLEAPDPGDDVPAPERRPGLGPAARPDPTATVRRPGRFVDPRWSSKPSRWRWTTGSASTRASSRPPTAGSGPWTNRWTTSTRSSG